MARDHARINLDLWGESCVNGHRFTDENTYHRPSGGRRCRQCQRELSQEYNRRRAAVA